MERQVNLELSAHSNSQETRESYRTVYVYLNHLLEQIFPEINSTDLASRREVDPTLSRNWKDSGTDYMEGDSGSPTDELIDENP